MKFKHQIGSRFIFDGGYDLDELVMVFDGWYYLYKNCQILPDLKISSVDGTLMDLRDIQTAVNLINILKDEGVV